MKLLAIDPSIRSLGWALFEDKELIKCGTITKGNGKIPLEERILNMIDELAYACTRRVDVVVIEKPQHWGAFKSVASTHAKGGLLQLHILVGALFYWASEKHGVAHLIPVSNWKGQLPKHITKERMEEKYGISCRTDDEADAIGLGNHYIVNKEVYDDNNGNV